MVNKCIRCDNDHKHPQYVCDKCGFDVREYRKKVAGL